MVDYNTFQYHYTNFLYYLTEHNPILAEYYAAKAPFPLNQDLSNTLIRKKIQTKQKYKNFSLLKTPTLFLTFPNSIKLLATVYTYGSNNIQPNFYRALKYIRMLRLLGDENYANQLTTHIYNQRKRKSSKILQEIK